MSRRPAEAPRFDVTGVKMVRTSALWTLLTVMSTALCVAAPLEDAFPVLNLGGLCLLVAGACGLGVIGVMLGARNLPAMISVEGDDLVIGQQRRRRIPLKRIAVGLILPQRVPGPIKAGVDPFRYQVAMELRSGSVLTIDTETMAEASAILEAARLDPSQRRFSLRIGRASSRLVVALFVAPFVFLGGTTALGFALTALFSSLVSPANLFFGAMVVTAIAIIALWRVYMSAQMTIGSDGIVVRRGFKRRFIPYGRLAGITEKGSDIALEYKDGKVEPIPGDIDDPHRRSALVQRMRDAMAGGAAMHTRAEALGRNGRPLGAWKEALVGLLHSDAGYRRIGLSREDALAIVKDAGARAEHRIAAAVALSATKDPEITDRIRIVASACASERMRFALEQAGEGELEEEAIAQALREERQVR